MNLLNGLNVLVAFAAFIAGGCALLLALDEKYEDGVARHLCLWGVVFGALYRIVELTISPQMQVSIPGTIVWVSLAGFLIDHRRAVQAWKRAGAPQRYGERGGSGGTNGGTGDGGGAGADGAGNAGSGGEPAIAPTPRAHAALRRTAGEADGPRLRTIAQRGAAP